MAPNEPVTDINEQMAQLSRGITGLDGTVAEVKREVQRSDANVSDLGKQVRQVDANLGELKKQVRGVGERVTLQGERSDTHITTTGERLIERIVLVEQDVAVIKSNYATQASVLAAKNSIIMWVVSAIFLAQLLPMLIKQLGG